MLRAKGRIILLISAIVLFQLWNRYEGHLSFEVRTALMVALAIVSVAMLAYQRVEGRQPLKKEEQPGIELGEEEIARRFQEQLHQYRLPTFAFYIAGISLVYWESNSPKTVPFPRYAFLVGCALLIVGGWLGWRLTTCPLCKERPPYKKANGYLFGLVPDSCPRCGVRFTPSGNDIGGSIPINPRTIAQPKDPAKNQVVLWICVGLAAAWIYNRYK
jgi:hypothetical protein